MRPPLHLLRHIQTRGSLPARCFTSAAIRPSGRTAPFRLSQSNLHNNNASTLYLLSSRRPHSFLDQLSRSAFSTTPHANAISFRDLKSEDKPKDSTRQEAKSGADKGAHKQEPASEETESPAERAYREAQKESEKEREGRHSSTKDESTKSEKEDETGNGEKKQKKKEEPPPPPPHGNKSPWQVFTETLQSEFQASKEWNESTKALSHSAHQFTENESVRKAREASSRAYGAATSVTGSALKGTGKVLGQSAAWTWDSTVVKGVRSGVNATGRGIDAATKPVRETKVYKSVKDVIDDGSSSRYGGWVEKEERRKKRELRELKDSGGLPGKRAEKMEEDPEYISMNEKATNMNIANFIVVPAQTSPCIKIPSSIKHGPTSETPTDSCSPSSPSSRATTNPKTPSSQQPAASRTASLVFSPKMKLLGSSKNSVKWTHHSK